MSRMVLRPPHRPLIPDYGHLVGHYPLRNRLRESQYRIVHRQALLTVATTVMCTPEPTTAEPTATPHRKKQANLYLQRRELDQDFAGGSVSFCSVHLNCLLWIRLNEFGLSLFGSEEIRRRTDNTVESESVPE